MKIQLYVTPGLSGENSIIRKLDGIYTMLSPHEIAKPQNPVPGNYYIETPGAPCDQAWAKNVVKSALLWADAPAHNYMAYGIPKDATLYLD